MAQMPIRKYALAAIAAAYLFGTSGCRTLGPVDYDPGEVERVYRRVCAEEKQAEAKRQQQVKIRNLGHIGLVVEPPQREPFPWEREKVPYKQETVPYEF
jgi:hypothetical protein